MKYEKAVRFEMERMKRLMQGPLTEEHRAMLFGAQEALAWALERGGGSVADIVQTEQRKATHV